MNDDAALIAAFFQVAARDGWRAATVAAAAREAGISLADARGRFPTRGAVLRRFGEIADGAALEGAAPEGVTPEGVVRDRLFDLLMRRFDTLQAHRDGVLALLRALPNDPPTAVALTCATRNSMRWMLQAAGVPATGLRGEIQVQGLMAVWLWSVRAWERDDSTDLSGTMAALDVALLRAEQAAAWLKVRSESPVPPLEEVGAATPPQQPDA